MSDRAFLDTNVVVYLFDASAPAKQQRAREVLRREGKNAAVSTQVLQEFYVSVTRKLGRPLPEAEAEAASRELAALDVVEVDTSLVLADVTRARADRLSLRDALIVEGALRAGCRRFLTENLQDGRLFGSLIVENPFRSPTAR